MPEGLSAAEVGKEIAGHGRHGAGAHDPARRDRIVSITEAVMLSIVAVIAAWSGFCAAKWGTESSLSLAQASATRTKANRANIDAMQIRTLDSVSFNAAFTALAAKDSAAFRIAVRRLRPGYRPAFAAWIATRPLENPDAPPGPAYMPQYRIPQETQARRLDRAADRLFAAGRSAGATADDYVRLTVLLATVLFLVGISSHFPVRGGRYGLVAMGGVLLVASVVQLLRLDGPPG
jgi:hypothetical protein